GRMHEAVPPGGALVRERLIAANRAVHNPDDAPAIEILGELAVRAERPVELATDTLAARTLAAGGELTIASEPRRVTYLAVRRGPAARRPRPRPPPRPHPPRPHPRRRPRDRDPRRACRPRRAPGRARDRPPRRAPPRRGRRAHHRERAPPRHLPRGPRRHREV